MNNFDWCEKQGRELFEKVLIAGKVTDYEFSVDNLARWDVIYSTNKCLNIVEIKVRNQDYTTYNDWILELSKYNALLNEVENRKLTTNKAVGAFYINFFKDQYFAIWDLSKVDISTVESKWCKLTTVNNSNYTWKDILPLKIEDACFFGKLNNNNTVTNERTND